MRRKSAPSEQVLRLLAFTSFTRAKVQILTLARPLSVVLVSLDLLLTLLTYNSRLLPPEPRQARAACHDDVC